MKANKYTYSKVIQQNYGYGHGFEDVSSYECNSVGTPKELVTIERNGKSVRVSALSQDLKAYRKEQPYPTRVVFRKELNKSN